MSDLPSTGERVIEERYLRSAEEYLIYSMHVATYEHVRPLIQGKTVLDFGCGTGYGSERVAAECASIAGVDVSGDAIEYARQRYAHPRLRFERIEPVERAPLPFEAERFDVVLSFQVIEHVPDADAYLREVRRVLKRDGVFVIATPDRATRLLPLQRPWNRFHLVEHSDASLTKLLARHFTDVDMLHMSGAPEVIRDELRRTRTNMLLALPLTLPWTPERVRTRGLGVLRAVKDLARRPAREAPRAFPYDHRAITIARGLQPSVNLVAHCRGPLRAA